MKELHLNCGASGSGKSSLVARLAKENNNIAICSADSFFVQPDGSYKFEITRLRTAHEKCECDAQSAMARKVPIVVIDNTNVRFAEFTNHLRIAAIFGYDIVFHIFKVTKKDIELLFSRNVHGVPKETITRQIDRLLNMKANLKKDMKSRFPELKYRIELHDIT